MSKNAPKSLLDVLRAQSSVDCDTMDVDVAKRLGPFVDCTSNQAIAYHELARVDGGGAAHHAQLIRDAATYAHHPHHSNRDVDTASMAVEVMMVRLALRIAPHLTGFSHVQANPKYAYDRRRTVENGQRIVAIFRDLDPSYDARRVCIKVPATWEGMQACRELEAQGIATLATTLFCMEQVALAAHVNCTYIAPYVNELRVHFDPDYVDPDPAFALRGAAQRYYARHRHRAGSARWPLVLPASLTSAREVMRLAGCDHITVSPPLLLELAATPADDAWAASGSPSAAEIIGCVVREAMAEVGEGEEKEDEEKKYAALLLDEARWRLAFTRSRGGRDEGKLIQALNIFCEKQDALEGIARAALAGL
ncbi:transaldolase [Xylariaceae sp. FL0804]|nr:transaldolase [Xylariaceae sp. FL0804]